MEHAERPTALQLPPCGNAASPQEAAQAHAPHSSALAKLKVRERGSRTRDASTLPPSPSPPSSPTSVQHSNTARTVDSDGASVSSPARSSAAFDALKRRRSATRAQSASAVVQRARLYTQLEQEESQPPRVLTAQEASAAPGKGTTAAMNAHLSVRRERSPSYSPLPFPQLSGMSASSRSRVSGIATHRDRGSRLVSNDEASSSASSNASHSTSSDCTWTGTDAAAQPVEHEQPSMSAADAQAELDRVVSALERAASASHRQLDWEEQRGALESASNLAKSQPELVKRRAQELVRAAVPSLKSLRSGVAKSALVMLREVSAAAGPKLDGEAHSIVPALCKQCNEQGFLAAEADRALAALTSLGSKPKVIAALLSACSHPSWQVRRKATLHLEKALSLAADQITGAENVKGFATSEDVLGRVTTTVASLLDEGSLHCRTLAKRSLFHLATLSGGQDAVLRHLSGDKAQQARDCLEDKRGMPEHPVSDSSASAHAAPAPNGSSIIHFRGSSAPIQSHSSNGQSKRGNAHENSKAQSQNSSIDKSKGPSFGSERSAGAADWRQRLSAVRETESKIKQLLNSANNDAAAQELATLAKRAADGSPRVAVAALDAVTATAPLMPKRPLKMVNEQMPSLSAAAAAASDETRAAAVSALDALVSGLGSENASRSLADACARGSSRARPALLSLLQRCASSNKDASVAASDEVLMKHVLPAAFSCIGDSRSRQAASQLLHTLAERVGNDAILSKASRLPIPTRQKVEHALSSRDE